MSCEEIVVRIEPELPPIVVGVSSDGDQLVATFEDSSTDIVVSLEETRTEVDVSIDNQTQPIEVIFSEVGLVGPPGPPGASSAFYYEHIQASPSGSWTIQHNLGKIPNISVIIDDETCGVPVRHIDENVAYISLSSPKTGKAVCS